MLLFNECSGDFAVCQTLVVYASALLLSMMSPVLEDVIHEGAGSPYQGNLTYAVVGLPVPN